MSAIKRDNKLTVLLHKLLKLKKQIPFKIELQRSQVITVELLNKNLKDKKNIKKIYPKIFLSREEYYLYVQDQLEKIIKMTDFLKLNNIQYIMITHNKHILCY